jgi:hypothetical protein
MSEETKSSQSECGGRFCQGAGPGISDMFRRLGPSPEAKRHFDTARVEFLKGLRTLIDQRISDINRAEPKGESITVE